MQLWKRSPVLLLSLLAACQSTADKRADATVQVVEDERPAWRRVATEGDQSRLDRLNEAWSQALADAKRGGFSKQIAAEGDLLNPDATLRRAAPSPGSYKCRIIKLGARSPGRGRGFDPNKPFFCFVGVDGDRLSITKQTGSQRPGGYLWDTNDSRRLVFLGSMALGDEETPKAYGDDPKRDMAGVFERYDNFRYRLVVPWPQDQWKLHVFEMIPLPQ